MDNPKLEQSPDVLLACRICLAWDTELFSIQKCGLTEIFKDVLGMTLCLWDGLPLHVCVWCHMQLLKAHALRARSCRADTLLRQALAHQHAITNNFIRTIDRSAYKLTNSLGICPTETCILEGVEVETNVIKDEVEIGVIYNVDEKEDVLNLDFKPDSNFDWHNDDSSNDEITVATVKDDELPLKGDEIQGKEVSVALVCKKGETKKRQRNRRRTRLTKKNKFKTEEDIKEFEQKYDFEVKCLTEDEMVADMERRKQSNEYVKGEFHCELCYRGFSTSTAYEKHEKKNHDPRIGENECHLCHVRYKFAVNRNQHIQDTHRLQFRCRRCDRVVPGKRYAIVHAAIHDGATFKCRHCDKRFRKQQSCATHMRLDHPVENAAGGTCEICGETFISRLGLSSHKTRAHNKPFDPELYCVKCRVQFDNLEALHQHKVNRPGNRCDPQWSVCCACGEWTEDPDSLVLHKHTRHGTALFTCDECNKSFLSKLSLATHIDRIHRGVRLPNSRAGAVCETCGKRFQSLAVLKQHQARHTGEKTFKCDICTASFCTNGELKNHRRRHTGEKPYKCERCSKCYHTAGALQTHRLGHTGEKPYKCERCSKCYQTPGALQLHVDAVHIGLRKYRCDQCPKTFLRPAGLYDHKVVHTGEKRYKCPICDLRFTQAGSVARHRKNVHFEIKP